MLPRLRKPLISVLAVLVTMVAARRARGLYGGYRQWRDHSWA